jgi:predicted nucleic acid-binding protein
MLVIADASPLHYLVLIEHAAILPTLFGRVIIPPAVAGELQHPRRPAPVRAWIVMPPAWLEMRPPPELVTTTLRLGAGERETLSLAQDLHADLLLLDDLDAREEAARHAFAVMGTLRVLELAAERELLDFPEAIRRLAATSFHLPAQLG